MTADRVEKYVSPSPTPDMMADEVITAGDAGTVINVPPILLEDGRFLLQVSEDGRSLVAVDRTTSRKIRCATSHKERITCLVQMAQDGWMATGSFDHCVRIWNFKKSQLTWAETIVFDKSISHLAAHPTLKMVAACMEGKVIQLRQIANKAVDELRIEIQDSKLTRMLISSDQLVYGTDMGRIFVWNYEDLSNPVCMLAGHQTPISHLSASEGYLASSAKHDYNICIWNLSSGKLRYRVTSRLDAYTTMCLDSTNKLLLLGTDNNELMVYGTKTKQVVQTERLTSRPKVIKQSGCDVHVIMADGNVDTLDVNRLREEAEAASAAAAVTGSTDNVAPKRSSSATCTIL